MWCNILFLVCLALELWFVYECFRVEYKPVAYANTSFPPLCVYGYSGDTLLSSVCYKGYNKSMALFFETRELGHNYPVARDISFFFTMSLIWPAICVIFPLAVFWDMTRPSAMEILEHIDKQMKAGVTQGIVYFSVRSVDDNMNMLYQRLRMSNIRFAIDKRLSECEGTRSYAISWATGREPPNVDTKPHIVAGGRQGELIQRLLDMLHWYEAEGYVSDDWSDDITETNV